MIQLRTDCLVFETAGGSIPCSAEQVAVELVGDSADWLDPEVIRNAAAGVLRYFREDLGKLTVTVAEFAEALAQVLRGFGLQVVPDEARPVPAPPKPMAEGMIELDLRGLATECGTNFELAFFPRLRDALAAQLEAAPRLLRLVGLRGCVKQLSAARRWCPRCRRLNDHIVTFLRRCLSDQPPSTSCAVVVI
jgi:hypothetical protein